MLIDMSYVSHLDSGQQAVGLYMEDETVVSGSWATTIICGCSRSPSRPLTVALAASVSYLGRGCLQRTGVALLWALPDGATANSGTTAPPVSGARRN
jgi:hypothetical protein